MRQAAVDADYYLQSIFDKVPKDRLYWPDRHYMSLMQSDSNRTFTCSSMMIASISRPG
ncbi:MAG TPA: hypothetical protein VIS96_10895 [Terrimicrobiaceae bacterium]